MYTAENINYRRPLLARDDLWNLHHTAQGTNTRLDMAVGNIKSAAELFSRTVQMNSSPRMSTTLSQFCHSIGRSSQRIYPRVLKVSVA